MLSFVVVAALTPQADPDVQFARDVQPILSEHCYQCHGPDAGSRKAGLRLDSSAAVRAPRKRGAAVVPGDPERSLLMRRVLAEKPSERMPPPRTGKRLEPAQIETLRRWIAAGATWEEHWSLRPQVRPAVPGTVGPIDPIDRFVRARLREQGLQPAAPADRETLLRRVTLDLTGLPPTPAERRDFLADTAPEAYERVVDRLLASPAYGERMAMVWLDAARYADTDGYQQDATRDNWPWRDWVVDAYNRNMPFDQFTREQFAGDLLPEATPRQILATSFHRQHMANGEGGRHREESRVESVLDRVNTVGTVWLGTTLGCAQCHDHKYDPVSQRDYYAISAFFDSIDEDGRAGRGAPPILKYRAPRVASGRAASEAWLRRQERSLSATERAGRARFELWLAAREAQVASHRSWHPMRAEGLETTHGAVLTQAEDGVVSATGRNARHEDYVLTSRPGLSRVTGMRLTILPTDSGRLSLAEDGQVILTNLKISVARAGALQVREVEIARAVADYETKAKGFKTYGFVRGVLDDDPRTGWSTIGREKGASCTAQFAFAEPVVLAAGERIQVELRHRSLRGESNIRRFRVAFSGDAGPAVTQLGPSPMERWAARGGRIGDLAAADRKLLFAEFAVDDPAIVAARQRRDRAQARFRRYQAATRPVPVMVLRERAKPRQTFVLGRGVWNNHLAPVEPGVPESMGGWPQGQPKNRLGLARYLTSGTHPLTARVAVNRYWQMYFGRGLVPTPEDFGRQGEQPTHPKLLDWLATEFVGSGWDVKHMQRLIVTSATYRQTSKVTAAARRLDPDNRWLSRAGRFRLPAWMIRDAALQVSGLLTRRLGGPPVYPYQPPGVWAEATMGRFHYARSVGDDLYRRSLYSFWRRMVAPTGMFDASKRRVCQVRVVRTNTPQQALTLLNDTTFVEAARVLAETVVAAAERDRPRLERLFLAVLQRQPEEREVQRLQGLVASSRRRLLAHRGAAVQLAAVGDAERRGGLDPVEVATFTLVASTLLNLDETLTHE